jgi:ABC-type Fe3+/spermidine/putrescine transport system ATPase subunit
VNWNYLLKAAIRSQAFPIFDCMTFLSVSSVSKKGEGDFFLENIQLTLKKFQKIAIAGETGSGKSTLLKIIAGLEQPDTGEINLDGETVKGPAYVLVPGHPAIGYLSQHFELQHALRVEQVLSYANALTNKQALAIYDVCQISHLLQRKTSDLSGGERQRIALAKLLSGSPKLLLLDEPYSNLDPVHQKTMQSVVRDVGKKLKITCMLVSHEPHETLSWSDKIIVMKDGKIVQEDTPQKIYAEPVNEYVAGLFGKYSLIRHQQAKPFHRLKGMKRDKRNMLLRPEHFKIVKKRDNVLSGIVQEVNFLGGYAELDIVVGEAVVTARTTQNTNKTGDKVYVAVDRKKIWYL